jgi:hypothetical protein
MVPYWLKAQRRTLCGDTLSLLCFLPYCAYYVDYHWDCHLYFVINPSMHRLYQYLHTGLTLSMTRTTTDTSGIWTMT